MHEASTAGQRYLVFGLCFAGGLLGGLNSTLVSSYLPEILRDLALPGQEEKTGAAINAAFIYGMLLGGLVLGYLGDRLGRKFGLQASMLCIGLFTLATVGVTTAFQLVICRLFCGFGVGGILLSSAVYISEIWPAKRKSVALGILSICFPVGIFSAGLITYSEHNWRMAFWEGLIPLGLLAANHFFIEESAVWLGRRPAESEEKQHGSSGPDFWRNVTIGSLIYGAMLIGLWAIFSWLPTWIQTIVSGSDGQQERGVSMMIFAAGGLAGGLVSGWICRIVGLKTVLLWCFGGCFVASLYLFKFTHSLSWLTYTGIGVIAVFFGASQGVLNVYIPELFPTEVRSVATGICFNISRLFTATAVFFIGWLVETLHGFGNALFVFSFVFLAGFLITLLSTNHTRYGIHKS